MKTKLIFLSILAVLGACSPTTVDPVNIPKAPVVRESAKPDLVKTQEGIDSSLKENTKIQEKLETQNQTLVKQKIEISEALVQAEKIKEKALAQQAITEVEAANLITSLEKISERNLFLEDMNQKSMDGLKLQWKMLEESRQSGKEALSKLEGKEQELKEVRDQNEYLVGVVGKVNKTNEKLQKDNIALTKKAATSGVYRNWAIGLFIASFLSVVAYFVLRVYLPKP